MAKKPKNCELYLVVQQGGSTSEMYASTYDSAAAAAESVKCHAKASYNALGPFEISPILAKALLSVEGAEAELIKLAEELCTKAIMKDFAGE